MFLKMLPLVVVLFGLAILALSPVLGLVSFAARKRGGWGGAITGVIFIIVGVVFWIWVLGDLPWPPHFG